jgi:SAM-dependent methyltransferase
VVGGRLRRRLSAQPAWAGRAYTRAVDAERARRAASFEGVAGVYERARPEYPADAVEWLVGDARRVLDLGAGTGKLTRRLLTRGREVVAVDPSGAMLAELRRAVPGIEALVGTAEAVPLPDASFDAVAVAQAFHWFDHGPALAEIARVLRPGGVLAIVWNARDEREPWVQRLGEVIGVERVDTAELRAAVAPSGLFGPLEYATFAHEQRIGRDALLELVASRSYCATREPSERAEILEEVARVFDEFASDGEVLLPYLVDAYRAPRL